MPLSTASERAAVLREVSRSYRPEFKPISSAPDAPDLKTLLLARALRGSEQKP